MVALLSECCCRDYYIPNFRIFYRYVDTHFERIDGIVYRILILHFDFAVFFPNKPVKVNYFWGRWYLYYRADYEYFDDKIKFPFSPYDSIELFILKPEYLGKYYLDIPLSSDDSYFDIYRFLYRNKTDFTDIVNLLMERFKPCFSPSYYYYMPILKPGPIDYYARLLTYDEFLTTIRLRFQEIFDYVKIDHPLNWSIQSGRYYNINFTIEKEPHTNADI